MMFKTVDFLNWIFLGIVISVLMVLFDPHPSGGLVGASILGISGSVVGGFLGTLFFEGQEFGFMSVSTVVAIAATIILMFISRLLRRL